MPPFVGVAVNMIFVPVQTVFPGLAEIVTAGVTFAFTVIVIALEVVVDEVTHVTEDVTIHVTISPFDKAPFVYVLLLVPVLFPFSFH